MKLWADSFRCAFSTTQSSTTGQSGELRDKVENFSCDIIHYGMEKKFKKEIWIGVGMILGSIAIFIAASTLLSGQMAVMSRQIAAARVAIAKRADLLANLAEIKSTSVEAAAYQKKINSLLPSQEQLLNFPQALAPLASARGVSLSFSFSGTPTLPQSDSPGVATFTLDTSGTLDALELFLNDIEARATRFLISIDGFSLFQGGSGYALNIQGRVFFQ